nr:hypothetical protein [Tanacetum cinerariifolium]
MPSLPPQPPASRPPPPTTAVAAGKLFRRSFPAKPKKTPRLPIYSTHHPTSHHAPPLPLRPRLPPLLQHTHHTIYISITPPLPSSPRHSNITTITTATLSPPQPPLITHITTSLPSPPWLYPRATIINTATTPSTQQVYNPDYGCLFWLCCIKRIGVVVLLLTAGCVGLWIATAVGCVWLCSTILGCVWMAVHSHKGWCLVEFNAIRVGYWQNKECLFMWL